MENNTISMYETVVDRYGKKHKVYGVRIKDLQTVTSFTEKYNPGCFTQYLMAPVVDDGEIQRTSDGGIDYDNGFYDDLMEIIELALGGKETRESIDEWLDMVIAEEIVMTFISQSHFKKKPM